MPGLFGESPTLTGWFLDAVRSIGGVAAHFGEPIRVDSAFDFVLGYNVVRVVFAGGAVLHFLPGEGCTLDEGITGIAEVWKLPKVNKAARLLYQSECYSPAFFDKPQR